jgi:hypothetical protein
MGSASRCEEKMMQGQGDSLEDRDFDMVGVTGSIPVAPTIDFNDLARILPS